MTSTMRWRGAIEPAMSGGAAGFTYRWRGAIEKSPMSNFDPIRQAIINSITGSLNTSLSWDEVKAQIPVTAVTRVSETQVCIDLSSLAGIYNIDADEVLTSTGVTSAWTVQDGGDITVTGEVTIAYIPSMPAGRVRRKGKLKRYPRRVMIDGRVWVVNNAYEERQLLLQLAAGVAEDVQMLEQQAQPQIAAKKRRLVRRLERRIKRTFDVEAAWQEFLASEDEEILLILAASRTLH